MAAGQAAARGLKVVLLEKKHLPARKLGITGKGRCNLTNTAQVNDFLRAFKAGANFMRFALGRFSSRDLRLFFQDLGVETVAERGGRVFPAAQEAGVVVKSLVQWVQQQGVEIRTESPVKRILSEKGRITGVALQEKSCPYRSGLKDKILAAKNVVIATGGSSYPATGSTGDGYALAADLGHSITDVYPALVPLITADDTAFRLQGLSLRNVLAEIFIQGRKEAQEFGEMLFTHFGVSGPIILTLSKAAVQALNQNLEVTLSIDLKPAVSHSQLKQRISRTMHAQGRKKLVNILKDFLPLKMIPVFLDKSGIDPDTPGSMVSAADQKKLRLWCKELRLRISGYRSFHEAIITSGGVRLSQVNPRTMESRLIKGLFFAGEVLDIDADTGGFNLQGAFSTGWVAGNSVPA